MHKLCKTCNTNKSVDLFYKRTGVKGGLQYSCIDCQNKGDRYRREKRKITGPVIFPNDKICYKCKEKKPISQFGKKTNSLDGHLSYCKPCWTAYVKRAQSKRRSAII